MYDVFWLTCTIHVLHWLCRFDYLHKRQSGGHGQYGRVIGYVEVTYSLHICGFSVCCGL